MRVIWSPTALRAVARVFDYLVAFNPSAATFVIEELVAAGDRLAQFPQRGQLVPSSGMRELVTIYPDIIRYRVTREEVRILRVRHASRQPTQP